MSLHLLYHLLRRRTKNSESREGFVADFCSICRRIRPFQLMETGTTTTVAGFKTNQLVMGYYMKCGICGSCFGTRDTNYTYVAQEHPSDLEMLIETTHPGLRTAYAGRQEMESELEAGTTTFSAEERRKLILEPMIGLSYMVDRRLAETGRVDRPTLVAGICTICGAVIIGSYADKPHLSNAAQHLTFIIMGIEIVLGIIFSLYLWHGAPARFVRSQIAPRLARALKPLRPERIELEDCLADCDQHHLQIGRLIKADWILSKIQ